MSGGTRDQVLFISWIEKCSHFCSHCG